LEKDNNGIKRNRKTGWNFTLVELKNIAELLTQAQLSTDKIIVNKKTYTQHCINLMLAVVFYQSLCIFSQRIFLAENLPRVFTH